MIPSLLLVDDEEGIRRVVGITLADMGYEVHTAKDGAEALRIFHEVRPNIVITDIKMPGMDGLELLRRIKAASEDTEVIMVTGHGDMDMAVESLKLRAADFIHKPLGPEVLEIALQRATERIELRRKVREHTENLERLVREQAARLVDLERRQAAGQVVEGLTGALSGLARDMDDGLNSFTDLPCFVSLHGRDLHVVSTNPLYRSKLGDKIGAGSWEVYKNATPEPATSPVGRTLLTGQGQRCRETVICVNGNDHPVMVHTAPIRGAGNEVELVLEIAVDIGEVQRLQEELRATRHLYQQLFDEAPCAITLVNPDLTIAAANRRFRQDFGEQQGALCHRACHGRNDPCPRCPALLTFQDGTSHQMETQFLTEDGARISALIWTAPIRDGQGKVVQVLELATDITETRRLQEHLTSLGMLLASLSHGIKGQLTALDGAIYKVNSGRARGDQVRVDEGWESVIQLAGRLKNMVMDILYWAKKRELNLREIAVESLLEETAAAGEAKAVANGVTFVKEFGVNLGRLTVDSGVLAAALVNLLENGVDACLAGGEDPHKQVVYRAARHGGELLLEVEDNGCGMSRETLDKLFGVFFSSKGSKGTGLGLFIAKKAVEQHGGTIEVRSAPGQGTAFCIVLPLSALPAPGTA